MPTRRSVIHLEISKQQITNNIRGKSLSERVSERASEWVSRVVSSLPVTNNIGRNGSCLTWLATSLVWRAVFTFIH